MVVQSYCTLLATILLLSGCINKDPSTGDLVKRITQHATSWKNLSYKYHYKSISGEDVDTLHIIGRAFLSKVDTDTVFGFNFLIAQDRGYRHQYLNGIITAIDDKENTFLIDSTGNKGTNLFYGNIASKLLFYPLIKGWQLEQMDSFTIEENKESFIITSFYATDSILTRNQKKLFVKKQSYLPFKSTMDIVYYKQPVYSEFLIDSVEFDNKNITTLIERPVSFRGYENKANQVQSQIEGLLPGKKAPKLIGHSLIGEKVEIDFSEYPLNLIDFWYQQCPPCLESIPMLNKLQEKYSSMGLKITGINSTDKNVLALKKFLNRNEIKYSTILTKRSTDSIYGVSAYPTLFLIKEDTVVYSQIGYSDDLKVLLDSIITSNL